MGPLTADRPKPLVEVAGKPLLQHVLSAFPQRLVSKFVVVTGNDSGPIETRFGSSFEGTPIEYVTQPTPRGLGDAVLQAEHAVTGTFAVINGDNLVRGDLAGLVETHREAAADATLLVEETSREQAKAGGVCVFDDNGTLTGYVEKPEEPPSTVASAGAFVFEPVIFHAIRLSTPSERGELELTDAVDLLLEAGRRVETARLDGRRLNVNDPADVQAAEALLKQP